jgi:hypothetical protein
MMLIGFGGVAFAAFRSRRRVTAAAAQTPHSVDKNEPHAFLAGDSPFFLNRKALIRQVLRPSIRRQGSP